MRAPCTLESFPTRRSSDRGSMRNVAGSGTIVRLGEPVISASPIPPPGVNDANVRDGARRDDRLAQPDEDRKSTRLNSSHRYISYAVFLLKKKNVKRRVL